MTSMIERVARAIYEGRNGKGCKPWAHLPKSYQEPYLKDAIAAIKAMREPTDGMVKAGDRKMVTESIYKSMIDAALEGTEQ